MKPLKAGVLFLTIFLLHAHDALAHSGTGEYWMRLKATNKLERSAIADLGYAIEEAHDDHVFVQGDARDLELFESKGLLLSVKPSQDQSQSTSHQLSGFPRGEDYYHDHHEVLAVLDELQRKYPQLIEVNIIGMSVEGKVIPQATLTLNPETHLEKPAIVFMGAHHAREHISVEVPLRHLIRFCERYEAGDEQVRNLLSNTTLYFIPLVNPDGKAHDIIDGRYKMWRKNRRLFGSHFGVDLNRNYGFQWGTGGSSTDPRSDVYMGPEPFSEPETKAMKKFVRSHTNINILLTYHSFGELILYPWGHSFDPIGKNLGSPTDFRIHKALAEKMSQWNDYSPRQSSDLYRASGDTTDWSYGELGIISFTFELDPKSRFKGGFYPGDKVIDSVVDKNWNPILFLSSFADNPERILED